MFSDGLVTVLRNQPVQHLIYYKLVSNLIMHACMSHAP